jgi:hypothetical protein
MDNSSPWLTAPADAYRLWQHTEAAGTDRRPFAERSISQHVAMFDRFLRHVIAHNYTENELLALFAAHHAGSSQEGADGDQWREDAASYSRGMPCAADPRPAATPDQFGRYCQRILTERLGYQTCDFADYERGSPWPPNTYGLVDLCSAFDRNSLENAAAMANHASTRTTQLCDRRHDEISLDEVERIRV